MLSVIVYGRNDNHGYNLHKRAALSLNSIAEILTSVDDEIIFVDYNSPNEVPTFPEAIADTLTPHAKRKLRIIRVRPDFHRELAGRTPLVALEPHSRNIAIRRANPQNRWILSTNTDMIIVPRRVDATLTSISEELGDGFYHLPRFEVPEGFWERLDRLDPARAIERMRRWGVRFHFNEIVLSGREGLYEAPGDFQLFLRKDLMIIGGFDERMILGWHVDSNIARRMALLRGSVDTAFDHLMAYHCGHTRQATIMHRGDRTENSLEEYVDRVNDPVAWWQLASWGAPDIKFEEYGLSTGALATYLDAMTDSVADAGAPVTEVNMGPSEWTVVNYEPNHVLPHLCDLLYHLPSDEPIFILSWDAELVEGIFRFLEVAHGQTEILLTRDFEVNGIEVLPRYGTYQWVGFKEGLQRARCVIIVNPGMGVNAKRSRDCQWLAQRILETVIEVERGRVPADRRRIIIVNPLGHPLQNTVHSAMSYTLMPPGVRLRHGYVINPPDDKMLVRYSSPVEQDYYGLLGRARTYSDSEREVIGKAIMTAIGQLPGVVGWQRLALELAAFAQYPAAASAFGFPQEAAIKAAEAALVEIGVASTRSATPALAQRPRLHISNRLCSGMDWEDPDWQALLWRYWAEDEYTLPRRRRWLWEKIAIVSELRNQLTPSRRQWVLIASPEPDFLAAFVAELGYRVAYVTLDELLEENVEPKDWTNECAPRLFAQHSDILHLSEKISSSGFSPDFAAILVPQHGLFAGGTAYFDAVLSAVSRFVSKDAVLIASAQVHINSRTYEGCMAFADWRTLFTPRGLLGLRGFRAGGEHDTSVPLDTVVRYAFEDEPGGTVPGLSYGYGDALVTVALISALWPGTRL